MHLLATPKLHFLPLKYLVIRQEMSLHPNQKWLVVCIEQRLRQLLNRSKFLPASTNHNMLVLLQFIIRLQQQTQVIVMNSLIPPTHKCTTPLCHLSWLLSTRPWNQPLLWLLQMHLHCTLWRQFSKVAGRSSQSLQVRWEWMYNFAAAGLVYLWSLYYSVLLIFHFSYLRRS